MTSKHGRFLSNAAEETLIQFVAINGESYDMYLHFAEKQSWKTFTGHSFHNWIFKKRIHKRILAAREGGRAEVRDGLKIDRDSRVEMLERDVDRLEELLDDPELAPVMAVRLMDQKRKNLEAIAKEAGEWNKPKEREGAEAKYGGLFQKLLEQKKLNAPEEPDVEGEFEEILEPTEPMMNDDGTSYA